MIDELPRLIQAIGSRTSSISPALLPPTITRRTRAYDADQRAGTRNALRLAERTGARLLLTSTSEVYGDPEIHPQSEDYRGNVSCTGPRACYDEGKRAAETLAFDFLRAGRADVRVARIFNTYGPRMQADDGRVVSNFIDQLLGGRDVTIYGDGSQSRCFCFVGDTVEGLLRLMASDRAVGVAVNLGDPREMTVRELAVMIIGLTGAHSHIVEQPLPEDDPRRRTPGHQQGDRFARLAAPRQPGGRPHEDDCVV